MNFPNSFIAGAGERRLRSIPTQPHTPEELERMLAFYRRHSAEHPDEQPQGCGPKFKKLWAICGRYQRASHTDPQIPLRFYV